MTLELAWPQPVSNPPARWTPPPYDHTTDDSDADDCAAGSDVLIVDERQVWSSPFFGTHDVADITPQPPDGTELWSYTLGTGRAFLRFSAISKAFLGSALFFLSLRGDWLKLLLPFAVMMVAGAIVSIIWSFQVKPFERDAHESRTRRGHRHRNASVDVYITTCGEDPDVIRNTIWHARHIQHDGDVHVYVLDDKNSAAVRDHARELGATYIHRPGAGWMKKAGNIHHAYSYSRGEFIIILDADFAAREDFLAHTLGYFEDDTVGIVQTPQYFRVDNDNWVEAGAASQQEQFYRIVQRARDRRGGAICVGTNAVYRRAALDQRGGMALLEHSEDLFTGMKVIDAGYRVSYLPVVLAAGSAPDNTRALASQQYRWARGNFALAGTPLFKRLRLTFMQRLSIWDGWIFYVTSGLSPLIAIVVPILTLIEIPEAISITPTLLIVPALLTEFVVQPRWLYLSNGPASRRVGLISQVAHLFALRDHLSDREQEWVPTGDTAGGRRQATDRIPELIASVGFFAFVATVVGVGVRAAQGFSIVALAPVLVLALIAIPTALTVTSPPRPVAPAITVDSSRDNYLDVVRGLSIIRVMFWHALGYWWISWAFAAMPAVFYVSGALFAKSMLKRSAGAVVKDRLKRLLPPYVAFLAASLLAVHVATNGSVWRDNTVDVISWIVPFQAPAALPWEQGWLSTPLWFLRALIVVLVITPVAVRVMRRARPILWAALWATSIVAIDVVIASADTVRATSILRGLGDIVVFGGFFAAGAAFHHRRHELAQTMHRERVLIALIVLTGAVAWMAPPVDWVVNNSNVMMGLVGAVWLVAVIVFEPHVRNIGNIPGVSQILSWVAANSMTVYLWHTAVLCVTFAIVGGVTEPQDIALFMVVFVPLLIAAVVALRPLEKHWSSQSGEQPLRILHIAAVVAVAAVLVQQPTLFPKIDSFTAPPAPSARPQTGANGPVPDDVSATGGIAGWVSGNRVREAVAVTIDADGERVTHSYEGVGPVEEFGDQASISPADTFEALSITKTMVASVALQLVDEGTLTLDGPMPALEGIDPAVTDTLTLRRLLSHSTGLVDYRQVEGFDPTESVQPIDAVNAAIDHSDLTDTTVTYSSTNYFVVGMAIEQVTGEMLGDELNERLFEPLGMDDTELVNNYRAGFVGYSSGGVVSTLDDLATWYDGMFRKRLVLSDAMLDEMIWGGNDYADSAGLGAWRHCPCREATVADPEPWLYLFHDGGDVRISYHPEEDVVIVSRFSKPLYGTPALAGDIDGFILQVLDDVT